MPMAVFILIPFSLSLVAHLSFLTYKKYKMYIYELSEKESKILLIRSMKIWNFAIEEAILCHKIVNTRLVEKVS